MRSHVNGFLDGKSEAIQQTFVLRVADPCAIRALEDCRDCVVDCLQCPGSRTLKGVVIDALDFHDSYLQ